MKLLTIISKSLKEQLRSFWVLLLTLLMGPFFIFVYYLITETTKPHYDICIVNNDRGIENNSLSFNEGKNLMGFFEELKKDTAAVPFKITSAKTRPEGVLLLEQKKADALIIIGEDFSKGLELQKSGNKNNIAGVEFVGDLTNTNYLISSVWASNLLNQYCLLVTNNKPVVNITETPLGSSGKISDFNMVVPGLLIVSLIMLMFTASISFVSEVENKTIIRLKLSKLKTIEFLGGISVVQLIIGILSVLLTLIIAIILGFQYQGSLWVMIFIAGLTSLSIIAFSLIIAAITKSTNEVLVVGNFPMFLFMFFTGAAFPLKSDAIFTIAGYPINFQWLMTPTHAISALNKTLVLNTGISSIIPEICSIVILTIFYFLIGAILFQRRHLRMVQ
jgi:ABC-2 type transport system permease protein